MLLMLLLTSLLSISDLLFPSLSFCGLMGVSSLCVLGGVVGHLSLPCGFSRKWI